MNEKFWWITYRNVDSPGTINSYQFKDILQTKEEAIQRVK